MMKMKLSVDVVIDLERGTITIPAAAWQLHPVPQSGVTAGHVAQAAALLEQAGHGATDAAADAAVADYGCPPSAHGRAARPAGVPGRPAGALPAATAVASPGNPLAAHAATAADMAALGVPADLVTKWILTHGPDKVAKVAGWMKGVMSRQTVSNPVALAESVLTR